MFFELEPPPKKKIPMLDWREIRTAQYVGDPNRLSPRSRKMLYQLCKDICRVNHYAAVAGTQIPEDVLGNFKEWENFIYVKGYGNGSLDDALLFNPQYRTIGRPSLSLEGCGSIGNGTVGFIAHRGLEGIITGIGYRPSCGLFELRKAIVCGEEAIILEHEHEHIQGGSIITNPHKLCSLSDIGRHTHYISLYNMSIEELLGEYINKGLFTSWLTREGDQVYQTTYVGTPDPTATWVTLIQGDWEKTPIYTST